MKTVFLTAAIAATMSISVFADISIKGDAHFRYADQDNVTRNNGVVNQSATEQRIRLHVTGKSGDTTVKLGLRNDGGTRVSNGVRGSGDETTETTGSDAGLGGTKNAALNVNYLFLTTKIGALTIKAGDWWDTTGFGLIRQGQEQVETIELGTKVSGWDLTARTVADSDDLWLKASGKVAGFKTDVQYRADNDNRTTDAATGTITGIGQGFTDIAVKGSVSGVGIAVELFFSENNNADANLVHVWKTISGITWHIARAEWEKDSNGYTNSKFSPLGISILGTAADTNGITAVGDVNNGDRSDDSDVIGLRADFKVAGMGVQATVGNLDLGIDNFDDTFKDIIITRALGKGSDIKVSYGDFADASTIGAKVSVKF